MDTVIKFFHMGGYGLYVWSAYGSVIAFLIIQGLHPCIRWYRYLQKLKQPNHDEQA